MEEVDGLKLAYDQSISSHLESKTIDYLPESGEFVVTDWRFPAGGGNGC